MNKMDESEEEKEGAEDGKFWMEKYFGEKKG